jgi:hypothetical protein
LPELVFAHALLLDQLVQFDPYSTIFLHLFTFFTKKY